MIGRLLIQSLLHTSGCYIWCLSSINVLNTFYNKPLCISSIKVLILFYNKRLSISSIKVLILFYNKPLSISSINVLITFYNKPLSISSVKVLNTFYNKLICIVLIAMSWELVSKPCMWASLVVSIRCEMFTEDNIIKKLDMIADCHSVSYYRHHLICLCIHTLKLKADSAPYKDPISSHPVSAWILTEQSASTWPIFVQIVLLPS